MFQSTTNVVILSKNLDLKLLIIIFTDALILYYVFGNQTTQIKFVIFIPKPHDDLYNVS